MYEYFYLLKKIVAVLTYEVHWEYGKLIFLQAHRFCVRTR